MSEGCQIEVRITVLAITENDASTELKCVTQNQAGRQEVVTHLRLEGRQHRHAAVWLGLPWAGLNDRPWLQVTELMPK